MHRPDLFHDTPVSLSEAARARPLARSLGLAAALGLTAAGCAGEDPNASLRDGLPRPLDGVYLDFGPAEPDDELRALIGFPVRDREDLERAVLRLHDPSDADFRRYFSAEDWVARHAPLAEDVAEVSAWLDEHGLAVRRVAGSRLVLQVDGTVAAFNEAFGVELRTFGRENHTGGPMIYTFGLLPGTSPRAPKSVAALSPAVVSADRPADSGSLSAEGGKVVTEPPPDDLASRTLTEIAGAYGLADLHAAGHTGRGETIGVIAGASFKLKDLQSFWTSMGVTRASPVVVEPMEPAVTRYLETTIDIEWAGGLAPEADLVVYQAPDARNTSLVYTYTEAISRAEVSVISNSFARREDAEAEAVRDQYDAASLMAAALGITVVAASGNSAETDTPSSSPYVTAVGGTVLLLDGQGEVVSESAWSRSGSGPALSHPMPPWQEGVVPGDHGRRGVVDLALTASTEVPYLTYYLGAWKRLGGTSLATPTFAAIMASVNSARRAEGLPPAGLLGPALYRSPEVQATFRDIVEGATPFHAAGPGWDYPTGWGAPDAAGLAATLP